MLEQNIFKDIADIFGALSVNINAIYIDTMFFQFLFESLKM